MKLAALIEIGKETNVKQFHRLSNNNDNFVKLVNFITSLSSLTSTLPRIEELNEFKKLLDLKIRADSMDCAIYYAQTFYMPWAVKVTKTIQAYSESSGIQRVFELAVRHMTDGRISHATLLHKSNMTSKNFREFIETLLESGRFQVMLEKTTRRPIRYYTPVMEDKEELEVKPIKPVFGNAPKPKMAEDKKK